MNPGIDISKCKMNIVDCSKETPQARFDHGPNKVLLPLGKMPPENCPLYKSCQSLVSTMTKEGGRNAIVFGKLESQ